MAPPSRTGSLEHMEELDLPGIKEEGRCSRDYEGNCCWELPFTENPAGGERKRSANQPQFQSALELMGFLEVIWSRLLLLIRQLNKVSQTQGKQEPRFPNKFGPVLVSSYKQQFLYIDSFLSLNLKQSLLFLLLRGHYPLNKTEKYAKCSNVPRLVFSSHLH